MRISFPTPTHLNSLFILFLLLPSILTSSFTIPNDSNSTSNISQIPFYPETQSNTELTLNEPTVDTDITSNPLALDDYMEFLRENNYFGKWTNFDPVNDPIQNYFDNPSGLMVIEALTADISQGGNYFARLPAFRKGLTNFLGSIKDIAPNRAYLDTVRVWSILIKLYDGNYVDQKSANVFYQILDESVIQFYPDNSTISVPDGELEIFIKDEIGDSSFYKHCAANFSLTFQDTRFGQPYRDTAGDSSNVGILFNITSDECNLSISSGLLTMSGFNDPIEIQLYAVISCTIALIEIFGAYKMRNQLRNRRMVFRTALGSVWLIATVDYYMLILHLVLVFAYSLIYIAPFVLYMILAFYLERELILRVLQARSKRDELDISDDSCRSCGFYFAISTGFFVFELVFILMSKLWVVYFNALIFLPQIYHNAKRDKPYNFNFYHIFLTGLIRIGFIAYLKYYPHNIFRLSPDPSFVIIYSSLMVAQVLILLVQTKFPRGFVSLKRKRSRVLTEEDVCPICMGDLKSESTRTDSLLLDFEETIETPCTHVFHVQCLKQWMSNKVECPVCRNMISEVLEEVVSSGSGGENENESEFAGNVEELEIQSVL